MICNAHVSLFLDFLLLSWPHSRLVTMTSVLFPRSFFHNIFIISTWFLLKMVFNAPTLYCYLCAFEINWFSLKFDSNALSTPFCSVFCINCPRYFRRGLLWQRQLNFAIYIHCTDLILRFRSNSNSVRTFFGSVICIILTSYLLKMSVMPMENLLCPFFQCSHLFSLKLGSDVFSTSVLMFHT